MSVRNTVRIAFAAAVALAASNAWAGPGDGFEFHGYFRETAGFNSKGGGQACFGLPGADFKARLGNECDNYWEAVFSEQQTVGNVSWRWEVMPAMGGQNYTGGGSYGGGSAFGTEPGSLSLYTQQNWGSLVFHDMGDLRLWVGDRYFHRENVDPFDWFFLNPYQGHIAAGVEDIALGSAGKAAFTVGRVDFTPAGTKTQNSTIIRAEARVYGVAVNPDGAIEIDLQADLPLNNNLPAGTKVDTGFMGTVRHDQSNFLGGSNTLLFQYGMATAMSNGTAGPTSDFKEWRIIENLTWSVLPDVSGGLFLVYQNKKFPAAGEGGPDGASIFSGGIRPAYHVSDNFKIALDFLYQLESFSGGNPTPDSASLIKVTLAPTFTLGGRGLYTRPELRFFVTYGAWNDGANKINTGSLGQGAFGTDKSGASFGAQYEVWF